MNNNLDDWLNSLGLTGDAGSPNQDNGQTEVPSSNSSQPLSQEDFNEILADNGFQEPQYDEAEEINEEDGVNITAEYNENSEEGRDLDAEEDAEWEDRINSGEITPVERTIGQIDERDALEAVQSVNEEGYQEHNPDEDRVYFHMPDRVVEVPVIHESEEVSQDAVDAFNVLEVPQQSECSQVLPEREPLIPPNSTTLLINDATSRFSGTEWYNEIQKARIIVAGIGGIGSNCVYQLARMNPASLFMYDDDNVEVANMSGQLYCQEDIGKSKVDAMTDMIQSYTPMRNIYAIREKFTETSEAGDIMICGFDNMAARKTFYNSWKNHVLSKPEEERYKCLFLDGRLSISVLQVFCLTGNSYYNWEEYEKKYLFSDAEAEETLCSLKQTTYLACMIGSVMVNLFTNFIADLLNPIIPYDLPFFTEYDAQNMIFKTLK